MYMCSFATSMSKLRVNHCLAYVRVRVKSTQKQAGMLGGSRDVGICVAQYLDMVSLTQSSDILASPVSGLICFPNHGFGESLRGGGPKGDGFPKAP